MLRFLCLLLNDILRYPLSAIIILTNCSKLAGSCILIVINYTLLKFSICYAY